MGGVDYTTKAAPPPASRSSFTGQLNGFRQLLSWLALLFLVVDVYFGDGARATINDRIAAVKTTGCVFLPSAKLPHKFFANVGTR